jgi:hypothetical protein
MSCSIRTSSDEELRVFQSQQLDLVQVKVKLESTRSIQSVND